MIRKAVVVVLSFAAVVTVVAGFALERSDAANELGKYSFHVANSHLHVAWAAISPGRPSQSFAFAGFTCEYWAPAGVTRFSMPLWAPFILFAAYPTIALLRDPVRRWHRRRKGWCLKCGYDLTGNVSGVCPECGERVWLSSTTDR